MAAEEGKIKRFSSFTLSQNLHNEENHPSTGEWSEVRAPVDYIQSAFRGVPNNYIITRKSETFSLLCRRVRRTNVGNNN